MGRGRRTQPKRLTGKLKTIRALLGVTQQEMVRLLKRHATNEFIDSGYISQFENGKREPALPVLLAYARMAGISTDILIDDKLDLPDRVLSSPKHETIIKTKSGKKHYNRVTK
jgi:transcriptional regulator with XRE-family HTH domain